jgi:hypothetical protein
MYVTFPLASTGLGRWISVGWSEQVDFLI